MHGILLEASFRWPSVTGAILCLMLIATSAVVGQDTQEPVPRVYEDGPSLEFDFPEMHIGIAEYDEGPTGTTVFYFPNGVSGAVDVRGGAPGTVNASALMNSSNAKMIQAVVFSGGSWYGLSAATGVGNGIKELKADEGNVDFIAGVVGGIIYDVGGRRFSRVTPDDRLGIAALRSAKPGSFPLGARGAGRFAMQGAYYLRGKGSNKFAEWPHSGQGGAFREIGPIKIGVFTVVNAVGAIVDRSGRIVRCKRNGTIQQGPLIKDRLHTFEPIVKAESNGGGPTENTTLTLVVTNKMMQFAALRRMALQVHSSMSRAIQPFATESDGDVLYAVSTNKVFDRSLSTRDLAVVASELAWDAVLSSVPKLPPTPTLLTPQPSSKEIQKCAGTYEFYGGGKLSVHVDDGHLTAVFGGNGRIYFDDGKEYRLDAAEGGLFVIDSPARDVIRFEESNGQITELTINPGTWAVSGKRLEP